MSMATIAAEVMDKTAKSAGKEAADQLAVLAFDRDFCSARCEAELSTALDDCERMVRNSLTEFGMTREVANALAERFINTFAESINARLAEMVSERGNA